MKGSIVRGQLTGDGDGPMGVTEGSGPLGEPVIMWRVECVNTGVNTLNDRKLVSVDGMLCTIGV